MEEMLNLHARNEMVESEEDAYIRAMIEHGYFNQLPRVDEEGESTVSPSAAGMTPLGEHQQQRQNEHSDASEL